MFGQKKVLNIMLKMGEKSRLLTFFNNVLFPLHFFLPFRTLATLAGCFFNLPIAPSSSFSPLQLPMET